MRLIWKPLGPFLDLLFCNCEDYVTAGDHGFDEYAQWVRDNQIDSAIFYSTTGLTVRDHLYLGRLEQVQRADRHAAGDARACGGGAAGGDLWGAAVGRPGWRGGRTGGRGDAGNANQRLIGVSRDLEASQSTAIAECVQLGEKVGL